MARIPLGALLSHCKQPPGRGYDSAAVHRFPEGLAATLGGADDRAMSTSLTEIARANGGYFTTSQARDCGFDHRAIREAIRAGEWRHLRRGAYAFAETYDPLSGVQQHLVLARAVVSKLGAETVAVTHQTASCAHGHDQWGWDLGVVNVTRLDGGSAREEAGIRHHVGQVDVANLEECEGLRVVPEQRAVVEACTQMPVEAGLCIVDSALRAGRVDRDMLEAYGSRFRAWPASRQARLAVWLGNGRAASVGESRARYLFWRFGVPVPELQFEVRDASGALLGTCDFGWLAYRHLGEFDGRRKYTRDLRPDEDAGEAVFREKRREDVLRAERLGMSRLVWFELDPPTNRLTAHRFRRDMELSRRLYTHNRVVIA